MNLVLYSKGKRIIGDSIKEYSSADLVLIGPNTPHAWTGDQPGVRVITIQFQENLFGEKTLSRKLTLPIKELMERSKLGIQFSKEITESMIDRILQLTGLSGFDSLLEFLSILYDLSISRNQQSLSSPAYVGQYDVSKSRRIKQVNDYLHANLQNPIRINDVASLVNMSPSYNFV